MIHSLCAGGVVLNSFGKIAMLEFNGKLFFPKGHVEPGEAILRAARREIYEETGLADLTYIKDLGSYQRPAMGNADEFKTIHMFLFTTSQELLKPLDGENHHALWIDCADIPNGCAHEMDKAFFISIKEHIIL